MGENLQQKYLNKRKNKAKRLSFCYKLFHLFPIKKNKIVCMAFEGNGGYCCNPRYIIEEIYARDKSLEFVWLVNDINKKFPEHIKAVKNTFLNRLIHLSSAKIWISNARMEYGTLKRKNQFYIQTWHGAIAFKAVGRYRGDLFPKIAEIVSLHDSSLIDILLSNSDWCTRRYKDMILFDGKIEKTGSARCDIFKTKRDELYKTIRTRYNLSNDIKIAIFCPTFRGGSQQGKREINSEMPSVDFEMLLKSLKEKFNGEWCLFLRLHPQLAAKMENMPFNNQNINIIDVSQADDMNELIAASDALITDYSSAAFDAINIPIPVFLYADDFNEYIKDRGAFMVDMFNLPFSLALTNKELEKNIELFNENEYIEKVKEFNKVNGVLEDGQASKRIADTVIDFLKNKQENNK